MAKLVDRIVDSLQGTLPNDENPTPREVAEWSLEEIIEGYERAEEDPEILRDVLDEKLEERET